MTSKPKRNRISIYQSARRNHHYTAIGIRGSGCVPHVVESKVTDPHRRPASYDQPCVWATPPRSSDPTSGVIRPRCLARGTRSPRSCSPTRSNSQQSPVSIPGAQTRIDSSVLARAARSRFDDARTIRDERLSDAKYSSVVSHLPQSANARPYRWSSTHAVTTVLHGLRS